MAKIANDINVFSETMTLFEYVEKHHPFDLVVKKFKQQLKKAIPEKYIETQLKMITGNYFGRNMNPMMFGYLSKIEGRDVPLSSFNADFVFWKVENAQICLRTYELENSIKLQGTKAENHLAEKYLETVAAGVNDALLENYLKLLQKTNEINKLRDSKTAVLKEIIEQDEIENVVKLMEAMNIIDSELNCIIKATKAVKLFAVISFFQAPAIGKNIFKKKGYTDDDALYVFNRFLGLKLPKIDRRSKSFGDLVKQCRTDYGKI